MLKRLLQGKFLPLLLISAVIIAVLVTIGDLGKLIEQSTNQNNTIDFGIVENCNPSVAVCSITGLANENKIRISMTIGEPISSNRPFPVNVVLSGITPQQVKDVAISLSLFGVDIQENNYHLSSHLTDKNNNLTSQWKGKLKIPQQVENRKDWILTVLIKLFEQTTLQLSYKLIVGS
ncbi:MAG: hypothetical protein QM479_06365 [Pseudomonadota bacterium]